MRTRTIVAAALLAVVLTASGLAQGKGKGKGSEPAPQPSLLFSELEKSYIRNAYRSMTVVERPPGYPKGGKLPPGLENKVLRGGKLPPGWLKKIVPFPPLIDRRMPVDPPHVVRGYVDGFAVIVDRNTEVVLDVFVP